MIYNLVIYIYLFVVKVAGLFSAKPAKMVKGHREVFDILRNKIDKNARYIRDAPYGYVLSKGPDGT